MYERIVDYLESRNASYDVMTHEPIVTSVDAAAARGTELSQGLKCLLLQTDVQHVLAVIPGDAKLASKKVRHMYNTKEVRFATPETVQQIMGCEVGACYPLGNLIDVATVFDVHIGALETVVFNAGHHDTSIRMAGTELINAVTPAWADIIKLEAV